MKNYWCLYLIIIFIFSSIKTVTFNALKQSVMDVKNITSTKKSVVFIHYEDSCNQTWMTLNSLRKQSSNLEIILIMRARPMQMPFLPIDTFRIVVREKKLPLHNEFLKNLKRLLNNNNCPI